MFRAGRVSEQDLAVIARDAESLTVTYDQVGATLTGDMPAGYRHDRYEIELPAHPDTFDRGVAGIRTWAPHRGAGLTVAPPHAVELGATVAVAAPLGPITAVAVCRIVSIVDEPSRYGFAYGSLPGHPERGEEAFLIERREAGAVFRIVAFSKPAELLARLGGPITRRIQQAATKRYLDGLAAYVAVPT